MAGFAYILPKIGLK